MVGDPKPKPIIIVQGAQWGSEGKGMVTAALCSKRNVDYAVRTGAVNAGHTVLRNGCELKMQQIPCGFMNPNTHLVLGAGAFVHPEILAREIRELSQVLGEDIRKRLLIDYRCGLHLPQHTARAHKADRHHKMGATGKGCSEALVEKISGRGTTGRLFKEWLASYDSENEDGSLIYPELANLEFYDTEQVLNQAYDDGYQILLEGTQGTLLDLHLGPYPYTTNKQTLAGQWALECGLSPSLEYEVVLVARTYPIRVAGNSGPMPHEIDWPKLARRMNSRLLSLGRPVRIPEFYIDDYEKALHDTAKYDFDGQLPLDAYDEPRTDFHNFTPEERVKYQIAISELHRATLDKLSGPTLAELRKVFEVTTVTHKLRRVADWDDTEIRRSIRQNRPAYLVLTFLNHLFPEHWGEDREAVVFASPDVNYIIDALQHQFRVPVRYVTTGPETRHLLEVEHGQKKAARLQANESWAKSNE